jgi:hypothetical protein
MICLTQYEDHDVDDDPIIVLPCKHFFAMSTLDGHLQISAVYETDNTGKTFTGLKSLIGASSGDGKPQQCPECRSAIHSVRRYGRFLRLVELRGLERKHVMIVDTALAQLSGLLSNATATPKLLLALEKLEAFIRRSPMRIVFEACEGDMEISPPPPGPLIQCLELQGVAFGSICAAYNDGNFLLAKVCFEQAIAMADTSSSSRSGARLRLALACLFAKHCRDAEHIQTVVIPMMDWIIAHPVRFEDLIASAQDMKTRVLAMGPLMQQELQEVMRAMGTDGGYNYGGSAASHWFECPNGHPFFIGECGGAMQTSRCNECGEAIGGSNHNLLPTNRPVSGAVRGALN